MKKYNRPDYVFQNSQTKWGLEGGGQTGFAWDCFCEGYFIFSLYFLAVLLFNMLRFFYNNRIKLRSLSDLQLFPQPGRCLL